LLGGQSSILTEIKVEKLIYGGEGLARPEGRVVLTPFVLPGELVRVRPRRESPKLLRASPVEILRASKHRVKPPCRHFGRCGGCHYQHADYEYQHEQKRAIFSEVLGRLGRISDAEIQVVSGPPLGYRNRIQLHVANGRIGFHQASSHRLCPVGECPIASPKLNVALAELRRMLPQPRFPHMLRSLELFTNETEVQINVRETDGRRIGRNFFEWCAARIPGADAVDMDYPAAGETLRVGPRSFFQANRFLLDRLVELALEKVEGETAADLYAGVGLFSLPLARRLKSVTAVESTLGAHSDLEHNAQRAGLAVTAHRGRAEGYLAGLERSPDFVLADPPRAGLGKRVVGELLRLKPARLTIVSCDPATLARDLSALIAGGYALDGITLVDLFPQTYHVESVTHLRAR